jgi:PAS domain S-box-containing protein
MILRTINILSSDIGLRITSDLRESIVGISPAFRSRAPFTQTLRWNAEVQPIFAFVERECGEHAVLNAEPLKGRVWGVAPCDNLRRTMRQLLTEYRPACGLIFRMFNPSQFERPVSLTGVPWQDADEKERNLMTHIDELLDEALEETFPASDPVAIDVRDRQDWRNRSPRMGLVGLGPSLGIDQFCWRLAHEAPDAVIYADTGGMIRFWNRGAERIFGFEAGEVYGRSLDIIIPENLRKRHWDAYAETMRTGRTRYGSGDVLAVPALRKDGSRLSVEFTILPFCDRGKRMLGVAAILRDVTKRFEETKRLREEFAALRAGR